MYDLFRNSLDVFGIKVTRVCISALVRNTYHARVHYTKPGSENIEIAVDARPSDALNLALRFNAPIYVLKDIAYKMASSHQTEKVQTGGNLDVARKCREELMYHQDPTVLLKLKLQLALKQERFKEARRIQNQIDQLLKSDRLLGLMVSLEAALEDKRYEEAQKYRQELQELR